ncbi:MAG: LysR substrate-binding domain-containing protein [Burkholderiaceae bacterium]
MIDKTNQRLRLNLRQLEVFTAIARAGSARAAADRVARSQSAASASLAELESVLAVELFDRVGRRLVLNENGRALLPVASTLLEQAAELEDLFSGEHAASLRIAASLTIGEYLLPPLLAQWKRMHANSRVRMLIGNTSEVIASIVGNDADVGFIEGSQTHPDLRGLSWLRDDLVIVAGPGHPLAGKAVGVAPVDRSLLDPARTRLRTRQATDDWLLGHLGTINVAFELDSTEAIKRLAMAGAGLACVSRHTVAESLAQGTLVELRTRLPVARRRLAIVVGRDKRLGRATQAFIAHCNGAESMV